MLAALALTACNDTGWPDRDPVILENPHADSLKFQPAMAHALPGDQLTVTLHSLKTVYACAGLLAFTVTSKDSADRTVITVTSRVRVPGVPECPLVTGWDTTFAVTAPAAGRTLLLRTPGGTATDSLFVFAGTGITETFVHHPADTLSTHGRFTFRDSSAAFPRRILYSDALASCETMQGAFFTRLNGGDTLRITYRTLTASPPLPEALLPACGGPHADTISVVAGAHGLPGPPPSASTPASRPSR